MTSAATSKKAGPAAARCQAACLAILFGLGVPGSVSAGPLAAPAPDRGVGPAIVNIQAPGPGFDPFAHPQEPGPAYAPGPAPGPPPVAAPRAGGRPISRAEFIERRRQAAAKNGRDPERAATRAAQMFDAADTNRDGLVDPAERAAFLAAHPEIRARGQQH